VEEKLGRPLVLSTLEDRSILRSFSSSAAQYRGQGYSLQTAYRKAMPAIKEFDFPDSLVPFIEKYMFAEGRVFNPEDKTFAFDQGVWNNWLQRIREAGGDVSALKKELATKIFDISHLEEWAAPSKVNGEYLYPDVPFIRRDLSNEEFLETVGQGYLKFFQDTRDEISGLWFDNSMDIKGDDPVISLPGIAGGLAAIPMLVEYGLIDAKTGYDWAMRALEALVSIQKQQQEYETEFIPFLEKKAEDAGIDLTGLTLAQKMQKMEAIRMDAEIEFLDTKGVSFKEFIASKGMGELTDYQKEKFQEEFLREHSPMFKFGWGGFLYRYWTQEKLPQRKVRWDLINDLSPVDTSYVAYSALTVGEYFKTYHPELIMGDTGSADVDKDTPDTLAREFYDNINWGVFLNPYGSMPDLFNMGWLPESIGNTSPGYLPYNYYEYSTDEGLMIAMLASMSDTHPVSQDVLDALHRERASYDGGAEYILSPTGTLFTYNLLDLWVDFSGMQYAYPEGDVNWDLNRRVAVLTNWQFSQDMADQGIKTFGPYTWSIDTGYTPKGLRMDYGSAFRIWEVDSGKEGRSRETTEYITVPVGDKAFKGTEEYALGSGVNRSLSMEAINAMAGYSGSALNSLRALISFRKIMQSYYKMWGEYGVRDSFGKDEDVVRTGGFIPNVWNSYDQMRGLNIFNLLGAINGKVTLRDLFMNNELIQQGLEKIGFRKMDTVKPVEISDQVTEAFKSSLSQQTDFTAALQANDFETAVGELHKILGLNSTQDVVPPQSKGDFGLMLSTIQDNITPENKDLTYYLLAETTVAEAVNIAKAACGDNYQQLIDGKNVDVTSAIVEYASNSDSLYKEALSYLRYVDESAIDEKLVEMVRGLGFVISKNSSAGIKDIINAYERFTQVARDGLSQSAQDAVYAYDYDGKLFGVYTLDELKDNPAVTMKVLEPLTKDFQLEPVLPEETGVISYFTEQVDGHSLTDIMEEVYIQSVLKPYAELVVGRPLDVADPAGNDAGYLSGLAAEVEGGFKDGSNSLETEIRKLKFTARMMVVHDKMRGARHDLASDPRTQDQLDILGETNLMWKGYITGKFNLLKPWQGIPKAQGLSGDRPVSYFATSLDSSQITTSEDVTYEGVPSLVIDEQSYYLPVILGNWYLPNQIKFGLRAKDAGGSVRLVIRNSKGEEASYRIDNVNTDSWTDVEIPLWGPYEVPWMSDKENAEWKDWLTRKFWNNNADGTYSLKDNPNIVMEYDKITDWSNITEVRIVKDTASDMYLGGIYVSSAQKAISDIAGYLKGEAQAYFEDGKAVVIKTEDNTTFFVIDVAGNSVKYIQVDPPMSPSAAQGFWNFRRGLGMGEHRVQTMSIDDLVDLGLKDNIIILDWI